MTQATPAPPYLAATSNLETNPLRPREYHATLEKFNLAADMATAESSISFAVSGFCRSNFFYATSPSLLGLQRKHHLRFFSHPAQQKIQKLFAKFRDIQRLGKNWNGYDADPIPFSVITRTRRLLNYSSRLWAYFEIFPTAADSIQLELLCSSGEQIEVEIGANTISLSIFDEDGSPVREEIFEKPNDLARNLMDALIGKELIS